MDLVTSPIDTVPSPLQSGLGPLKSVPWHWPLQSGEPAWSRWPHELLQSKLGAGASVVWQLPLQSGVEAVEIGTFALAVTVGRARLVTRTA